MKTKLAILGLLFFTACSHSSDSAAPANPSKPTSPSTGGSNGAQNPGGSSLVTNPTPAPTPMPTPYGVALIWNGSGVCKDGCVLAAQNIVKIAGMTFRNADDNTLKKSATDAEVAAVFQDVKVWIMPGGTSTKQVGGMSSALKAALKAFIQNGGGYVGWGAGAFATTEKIGTSNSAGLGILPGSTTVYHTDNHQNYYSASIEQTTWFTDTHYFYLEGGPYLFNLPSTVEVVGRYSDLISVAAARTTYGTGRVFVSGFQPEAPEWWWKGTGITDSDGTDEAYAASMLKWAAHFE